MIAFIINKSNKYCLFLLDLVGTTFLNTIFYIIFGFLLQKWIEYFLFGFSEFFRFYIRKLYLEDSKIFITDHDLALMTAIRIIFSPYSKLTLSNGILINVYKLNRSLYFNMQKSQKKKE